MELKFDDMDVKTPLAQAYLQDNVMLSTFIKTGNIQGPFYDGNTYSMHEGLSQDINTEEIDKKMRDLALILKKHICLFAQLEYLIRKVPIDDTKAQIQLIIQQLHYVSYHTDGKNINRFVKNESSKINYRGEAPLLMLGCVARRLMCFQASYICADNTTAATAHLFTKLCRDVGLGAVRAIFDEKYIIDNQECIPVGGVGVISEQSDVDSAVDVFLASSKQVPWRLQKILVQESVYPQFNDALTWKCNLNNQGDVKIPYSSTSNTLEYNGRLFLIDSVETTPQKNNEVTVEAYRTRKELITLLKEYRPHYLSLWANDIAEINEIAHSVSSPVVWVNSFADFRGPSKITETIFSYTNYNHIIDKVLVKNSSVNELATLQQSWLLYDFDTRREILCNVLDKCSKVDLSNTDLFKEITSYLQRIESGNFVDVGKDYVCFGVSAPLSELLTTNDYASKEIFKAILYGNAFAVSNSIFLKVVEVFKEAGVPIVYFELGSTHEGTHLSNCSLNNEVVDVLLRNFRVIWTNSGTIFAN